MLIKGNMFDSSNVIVLNTFDILLSHKNTCSSLTKGLYIVAFMAMFIDATNDIVVCCVFSRVFSFLCFWHLFLLLLFTSYLDNSNSLVLLSLLFYCSLYFDVFSLNASFVRFFKIGVGLIDGFSIIPLHIDVRLSSIGVQIIIKDNDKGDNKYCLREALKECGKTDIKDFNKNSCSTKELAATRHEYCTEK